MSFLAVVRDNINNKFSILLVQSVLGMVHAKNYETWSTFCLSYAEKIVASFLDMVYIR